MSTLQEDIAFIRANKRFLTLWERVTFPLLAWLAIKFEPYRLRRLARERQPVPGVYGPEQHAAGFVAKEVG